jgi:hypothetical protein
MWSETRRPEYLDGVVGHVDVKARLCEYLQTPPYEHVILLHGHPGTGKTTMALAAARTYGMEPLEINASYSMRSHADVEKLVQSCEHTQSISSFIRGDKRRRCLVLDEIDGSDPHAQRKLVEWMTGDDRKVPVIMTCNEVPHILKHKPRVEILRCYPPKPADLVKLFPEHNVTMLAKRFKHDVRRMLQYLQYGESDPLPNVTMPVEPVPEILHILKQKMWHETCPIVQASESGNTCDHCPSSQ